MEKINVNSYIVDSIVDGPGLRFVIFTQGCKHDCVGCHNKSSHSFKENNMLSISEIVRIIEREAVTKKVTISGGDPLFQVNPIYNLCKQLKEKGYNIILYTGFRYESIKKNKEYNKILDVIDILIDGKYDEKLHDYSSNTFVGSTNQRVIQLDKSE